MEQDIKATIIGLLSTAIGLVAVHFAEYRIIIISLYSIALVGYFLLIYINKIEAVEEKIKELEKSFKRAEDLITIRADIETLKRK